MDNVLLKTRVILGPAGTGKCLGRGTPVLMFNGAVVPVELIVEGDLLMGPDSLPRRVLATTTGTGPLFKITPTKGDPWICNGPHVMTLKGTNQKAGQIRDVPLDFVLKEQAHRTNGRPDKDWKLFRVPVNFRNDNKLPVDPYLLGTCTGWTAEPIGDGEYFGFELPGDGRFLLGDLTVTHNSTLLRAELEDASTLVTATTGVAAYNLGQGAITINSALKFFDAASLWENLESLSYIEMINRQLYNIKRVIIDEISMMKAGVLDLITSLFEKINHFRAFPEGHMVWSEDRRMMVPMQKRDPLELVLVGDFCQLPPVIKQEEAHIPGNTLAFYSGWWNPLYRPTTEKLTKIWRQSDPVFLQALAAARGGSGRLCTQYLQSLDIPTWATPNYNFEGFSLYPTNASVNKHNEARLDKLDTKGYTLEAKQYGQLTPDLREIPVQVAIKIGCRVRMTVNTPEFVNGELATVREVILVDNKIVSVHVELDRPGNPTAVVGREVRFGYRLLVPDEPLGHPGLTLEDTEFPYYDDKRKKVVVGAVSYFPMKLGYAATYHGSQGLQFDNLQLDVRGMFAGSPQMVYVGLSRCTSPSGLRVVGNWEQFARRVVCDPRVREFV